MFVTVFIHLVRAPSTYHVTRLMEKSSSSKPRRQLREKRIVLYNIDLSLIALFRKFIEDIKKKKIKVLMK